MDYYSIFVLFLRNLGCEKSFNENFHSFNRYTFFCRDLWDILGGDEYFLNRAFDWADTPQGRDYWLGVSNAWEKSYMKAKKMQVAEKKV